MFSTLTKLIDREDAISFCKEYVNHRLDVFKESTVPVIESLEQLFKGMGDNESSSYNAVNAFLEGGMVVSKVNRCMWHDLQKEFDDCELAYLNSCYGDFHMVTLWNGNFELTRTKTLMQGDDYCDFCWHDKRIDQKVIHPPLDFWTNLE